MGKSVRKVMRCDRAYTEKQGLQKEVTELKMKSMASQNSQPMVINNNNAASSGGGSGMAVVVSTAPPRRYNSCRCSDPTCCCVTSWVFFVIIFPFGSCIPCCHDQRYAEIMHARHTGAQIVMKD